MSLEQIRAFLKGNEEVGFKASNRKQTYEWTQRTLCAQEYSHLPRYYKGLVKKFITSVTGLSPADHAAYRPVRGQWRSAKPAELDRAKEAIQRGSQGEAAR